jgi:hypothetical protein
MDRRERAVFVNGHIGHDEALERFGDGRSGRAREEKMERCELERIRPGALRAPGG